MRPRTSLPALVAGVCVGAAVMFLYGKAASHWPWSKAGGEVRSGMAHEVLVMRTPGGLLEVSRIEATEQFDKRFVYSVLGAEVGETVAHIRVPVVYRYHIELAPEWEVYRSGDDFRVITPPVRPSLPVAADLARMEKDVGGTWLLVPFNKDADLATLEREVTSALAAKAASPAYLQLQRDDARRTVTEFVRKWLITQEPWKSAQQPRIEVAFSD